MSRLLELCLKAAKRIIMAEERVAFVIGGRAES